MLRAAVPETEPELPTFDVLRLSTEVRKAIDELGYTHPTPVQRAIFEPAKKGKDLVVQARTGTGKTAAFGLPLVDGLIRKDVSAVQAMVLCPTRELALQVARELTGLSKYSGLKVVSVYGGAPMQRQIDDLKAGAQVVVGTPGRVLDHLRRGTLDSTRIKTLILDESDEMLSMGFLPQINDVLECLPKTIQTLLFSATVPRDVVRMAENRLRDPVFITLSGDEIGALEIDHYTYLVTGEKLADFLQVIETENPESAIVFCNTREQTKRVAHQLKQAGFNADWLNAELSQSERERVMAAVRDSSLRFLVATDVAARGIDISHLTHVINYDFPESTETYVHRTGRTGRAGNTGTAISMVTPQDIGGVYMLKLTYRIMPVERSLPSALELRTRAELDLVEGLVRLAEGRRPSAADRALARRLLTHEQAEVALAMLLADHLGPRADAEASAASARRASAPQPAATPRGNVSREPAGGARPQRQPAARRPAAADPASQQPTPAVAEVHEAAPVSPAAPATPAASLGPAQGAAASPARRGEGAPTSGKAEPPAVPRQDAKRDDARVRGEREAGTSARERGPERPRQERPARGPAEGRGEQRGAAMASNDEDLDLPGYSVADAPIHTESQPAARAPRERAPRGQDAAPRDERPRDRAPRDDRPQRSEGAERPRRERSEGGRQERAQRPGDGPTRFERDDPAPEQRVGDQAAAQPAARRRPVETAPAAPGRAAPERAAQHQASPAAAKPRPQRAPAGADSASPSTPRPGGNGGSAPAPSGDPDSITEIFVNVGRKDGARPSDFRKALSSRGSLPDSDTDYVNVRHGHAFIGVKLAAFQRAVAALNGATIAGKEASAELAQPAHHQ